MKKALSSFLLCMSVLGSLPAKALVDFSFSYSNYTGGNEGFNNNLCLSLGCGKPLKATSGIGFDFLVMLPMVPIGVGVRYEDLSTSFAFETTAMKYKFNRTALLVNWRLLNNIVFLGPIASYGIVNRSSIDIADSESGTSITVLADQASSYSVGLEAGVDIAFIRLGVEAGYASLTGTGYKSGSNTVTINGSPLDNASLTGPYYRGIIGFIF